MPLQTFEHYHGAVLRKVCRRDENIGLTLIDSDENRSAYKISGKSANDIWLYIKHSATPTKSRKGMRWSYTFTEQQIADLREWRKENEIHLALLCVYKARATNESEIGSIKPGTFRSEIAFIEPDGVDQLLRLDVNTRQWVRVRVDKSHSLRVHSSNVSRNKPITISRIAIDNWDAPEK